MAFTQDTFASVGANSTDAPAVYSYNTTDSLATVAGALYFNDKVFQIESGDIILVNASDGFAVFNSDGAGSASVSVAGSSAPIVDASCYVDPTSGTPIIQKSYNVSSITDDGVGIFRINFTTALASANYCVAGIARTTGTADVGVTEYTTGGGRSTTQFPIRVVFTTTSVDEKFSLIFMGA